MGTIAAISTPSGTGGVAIIRVSGSGAESICAKVFCADSGLAPKDFPARKLISGKFCAKFFEDKCLAVVFRAPFSFTGEDTAEFHLHGGAALAAAALDAVLAAGARLAEPGEFSKRAFINGKIDLSAAEGIISLITAESEAELRAAAALADGEMFKACKRLSAAATDILAEIETGIDFPDADAGQEDAAALSPKIAEIIAETDNLLSTREAARHIKDGINIVIAGLPNVGKSSLLNALLKYDRAIVTPAAGTTRDTISETFTYRGVKMRVTDTAGIRESSDLTETLGVERSRKAAAAADVIILLKDAESGEPDIKFGSKKVIEVVNKCDLPILKNITGLKISAFTGEGITALLDKIYEMFIGGEVFSGGLMLIEARHYEALLRASAALKAAAESVLPELIAEDMREALLCFSEITGESLSERVVDRIFEKFCLGK